MKRSFPTTIVVSLTALVLLGSGCAVSDLKNTNRRLKENNDRLVAENNRLEQELAAAEREAAEKAKRIDGLQTDLDRNKVGAPTETAAAGEPAPAADGWDEEPGVSVRQTAQGTLLRLDDKVFFPQGQATLSGRGESILKNISRKIQSRYRGHMIRVEGHTDDVPINKVKNKYPSNWELSTARACSVVRYLVDRCSLSPTKIYPAGFAYYKPIASARTASGRSQNRRVEILILNEKA